MKFKISIISLILCICGHNGLAQLNIGRRVALGGSQIIDNGISVPSFQRGGGIYTSGLSGGVAPSSAQIFALIPVGVGAVGYGGISGYGGYGGYGTVAAPAIGVSSGISGIGVSGLRSGISIGNIGLGGTSVASQNVGPINAAIITRRTVDVVDVPVPQDIITPQTLIVEPNQLPVNIEFRSQSSPVNVNQVHIPGPPGTVQRTSSEEEPDRLVHEVIKPVIQEIRETITPYRTITQEILPVQENINTVVARGQGVRQQVVAAPVVPAVANVVAAPAVQQVAAVQPVSVATLQPINVGVVQPIAQPIAFGLIGGDIGSGGLIDASRRVVSGGISGGTGSIISGGLIGSTRIRGSGIIGTSGRVIGQPFLINRRA